VTGSPADRDGRALRWLRAAALLSGGGALLLAAGFLLEASWATNLWPWLATGARANPTLSSIFLASIAAAICVPEIWIGVSGELGAATGGAINLSLTAGGVSIFLLNHYRQHGDPYALTAGLVCAAALILLLATLALARRYPLRDTRPMPAPVRISFAVFALVLMLVGVALLLDAQDIYPWWINPETGALYGWIYLGAASYFLYGLLYPRWHNACGQLLGFLAYDLVLLPPFLAHFAGVEPGRRASLTVYTAVLVYSAALACYYLFVHRATRWWDGTPSGAARQPPSGVSRQAHP
jgi:hypothetical protein